MWPCGTDLYRWLCPRRHNPPLHAVQFASIRPRLPAHRAGRLLRAGRLGGTVWALRWLALTGLIFYGWSDPGLVLLLGGSILVNYILAEQITRRASRWWLIGGVTVNLALLAWFKYANFLVHDVLRLHAAEFDIVLPLAISFFTFQQITYLVDTSRGENLRPGLLPYTAFVAFFPHLIAGPIVRQREVLPQLLATDLAGPRIEQIADGITIFLLGMAKKGGAGRHVRSLR